TEVWFAPVVQTPPYFDHHDVYTDDFKGWSRRTNVTDAEQAAVKVTRSVHETGGVDWDGKKIHVGTTFGEDAAKSTKISINARIVNRLQKEMSTDKGLQSWAD